MLTDPFGATDRPQSPLGGDGHIAELATSAPGNSSIWPNTAAPLAKVLLYNGYSTAQFGKCHEVPVWETSPMGPYRQWPTGMGFEHFYGFIGGETNQWYPELYEGVTPVEPPGTPEEGYYFNDDQQKPIEGFSIAYSFDDPDGSCCSPGWGA